MKHNNRQKPVFGSGMREYRWTCWLDFFFLFFSLKKNSFLRNGVSSRSSLDFPAVSIHSVIQFSQSGSFFVQAVISNSSSRCSSRSRDDIISQASTDLRAISETDNEDNGEDDDVNEQENVIPHSSSSSWQRRVNQWPSQPHPLSPAVWWAPSTMCTMISGKNTVILVSQTCPSWKVAHGKSAAFPSHMSSLSKSWVPGGWGIESPLTWGPSCCSTTRSWSVWTAVGSLSVSGSRISELTRGGVRRSRHRKPHWRRH